MSKFNEYAPRIMSDLMHDFRIGKMDAAAIVGNLAHESGGFEKLQELKPTVKGSRGGFGWAQWTGPRRRQYEAWAKDRNLDPAGYQANYSFMKWELSGPYKNAIKRTMAAETLNAKVVAFEMAYEKAGVKHYASRNRWAKKALERFGMAIGAPDVPRQPGVSREAIQRAQHRLRELAYFEVGKADGVMGSRTVAAITAFQMVEGLKRTGELDAETLARLETAQPRPVSAERENLTVDDLRKEGSKTITRTDGIRKNSIAQMVLAFCGAIISAVLQFFSDAWDKVSEFRYVLTSIPVAVWFLIALGLACFMYWQAGRVQAYRLEDERTGKHSGAGD